MPFLISNWKLVLMVVLLAALGVQTLRVSNRDTTIAEQQIKVNADNATIDNLQKDQAQKKVVISALQAQAERDKEARAAWQQAEQRISKIVKDFKSVPAQPKQDRKEVLDDESSARAVDAVNSILDRLHW